MKLLIKAAVMVVCSAVAVHTWAAGDVQAGESKSAPCAACHGQDGNSAASINPKLAGQGEQYLIKQLQDFKSGARENAIMAGQVQGLSEQDMADLAAYYASQTVEVGKANPDYVKQGGDLYRGGNLETGVAACAACHGPAGEGMPAAGFPALAGQHADYTMAQLKAFRAAGRGDHQGVKRTNDGDGSTPGMMQAVAAKMSDDEIRAVASFIAGLSN